jgi:hypothetical protein
MAEDDDYLTEYSASSAKRNRSTPVTGNEPQPVVRKKPSAPKRRRPLLTMVLSFAFAMGVAGVVMWFVLNRHPEYIESHVVMYDGKPMLIEVDGRYSYSENDGKVLTGYVLILTDVAAQKEVHRLDIEADSELDTDPAQLHVFSADNIWLVKMKANRAGSKGLLQHYKISNNAITAIGDEQNGFAPSRMTSGQHLVLADEYNEVHCFDLRALTLSDGECPYIDAKDTSNAAFFSSVANVGATRSKVYYYSEPERDPAADTIIVSMGTLAETGVTLGYEVLAMNRQQMTDDEVNTYTAASDSGAIVTALNNGAYFYDLEFTERTPEHVIFSHTGEQGGVRSYSCYGSDGKLMWTVTHDLLQETPSYRLSGYSETADNVMYVTIPYSWSFAVDLNTRKLLWVYSEGSFRK